MRLLANLVLTNLFLVCLCWLALRYGQPNGHRWIDRLNRFFSVFVPNKSRKILWFFTGEAGVQKVQKIYNYILNQRNPSIMILYLIISIGGYLAFVLKGYPHLPNETLPFPYHKELGFVIFCASLHFFNSSATSDPGIITKSNHSLHYDLFPYDEVVFKRGIVCYSCKLTKPARSKHCRFCDKDIARFDHHCVWINQCVGLGNMRSFLFFLLFNNIMCMYGGYLGIGILYDMVVSQGLQDAWFQDTITGQRYKASPYYLIVYLLGTEGILCYITIICIFMGSFLSFFTWYHWVTLMRNGITTNEDSKLDPLDIAARGRFLRTYSTGSWWSNLKQVWALTCPPLLELRKG